MNASQADTPPTLAAAAPPAAIAASCRGPLMFMLVSAAFWLLVSSVFGLIASIKFHSPGFLADTAWLTYGRVHPAQMNALVYGFALQAGLAVALGLLCQLGRNPLALRGFVLGGGGLWNLGVLTGISAILRGESSGFEWLEMPQYVAPILFVACVLVGVAAVLTFVARRERALSASHWFLLAALFWFPWIYTTANLLLLFVPVRGVMQAVVNWWYVNNLLLIWLGFVGLGALFHLLPMITGRTLQTRPLALFVFWVLAVFGSWAGIPPGAPVPAWIPAVSSVGALVTVMALVAVAMIFRQTVAGGLGEVKASLPLRFIRFGAWAFMVAVLMYVVTAVHPVSLTVNFTWFIAAQLQLNLYGFFAMMMFGAVYHLVPLLLPVEKPPARLGRAHFWLAATGVVLFVVPLAVGGVVQGLALANPDLPFMDVVKKTLPFLRSSTVGDLLIALANLIFFVNLLRLSVRYCRAHCWPVVIAACGSKEAAEAAS